MMDDNRFAQVSQMHSDWRFREILFDWWRHPAPATVFPFWSEMGKPRLFAMGSPSDPALPFTRLFMDSEL